MADIINEKQNNHEKTVTVAKNAAELQKIRLEKLMSNPDKPAHIPEASKPYKPREPLEFIRNVWGSSAGAGSGDFHVYRGVRRREYARQKFNKEKNDREDADEAYHKKVEENAKAADERTAKKRAKRQKKKQKMKNKKPKEEEKADESEGDDSEDDDITDNVDKIDRDETCVTNGHRENRCIHNGTNGVEFGANNSQETNNRRTNLEREKQTKDSEND